MSAATVSQLLDQRDGRVYQFPVAAATKLLAGVLWALDASNRLVNASDAAARRVIGVGHEEVDNTDGSAGDLNGNVHVGLYKLVNGTDTLTDAHIGKVVFVEDNQTVQSTPGTNGVKAGILRKVDSDGVWVEVGNLLRDPAMIFAAGIHTWAGGAATTDSISVVGLLATDIVLVTLVLANSTQYLVKAVNDAGNDQIDLTLSANGADGTCKLSYLVLRPTL